MSNHIVTGQPTLLRKRCSTCRFWGEPHLAIQRQLSGPDVFDVDTGLRKCTGVPFYGEDNRGMPAYAAALAVVRDGEGYLGELLTRADFGCVLHESCAMSPAESGDV